MRIFTCLWTLVMLAAVPATVLAEEEAPQAIVKMANSELAALGTDPVIVAAVKTENAKGKTLDQIKITDAEWQKTAGVTPFMKAMMESTCGKHLQTMQKTTPFLAEVFVMDNLGANVAMTDKTSDYWQGDEPKFIESFKSGQGAIHIGKVKFDESTQVYLVQVSVPVKDGDKAIGAITIGIDLDKFEAHLANR
jgi:hypothetical protein